ncbi:MAG: hypothetical protein KGH71_00120 [Candidatus Micrarchaeota archaeon]|nr:hypothetical protein [Candidatus Micrarchaeota archaeon]
MLSDQVYVVISSVAIALLSLGLAVVLAQSYLKKRTMSRLFWSLGMDAFALSATLQVVFSLGIYGTNLVGLYLFLVVILVQLFSLGALQTFKNRKIHLFYYGYVGFTVLLLLYSIVTSGIGNLLKGYVVAGLPPDFVIWTSSIATFPAAILIIISAAIGYERTKNAGLLSIVAGIVIVGVAGTLYISAFPEFLYISEFAGVLLLWYGVIKSRQ